MTAEPDDDLNPTRIRIGLAIIAVVMVVAIGVFIAVESSAARFLFAAIIVIGLFQMWRIFRAQRRK